MVANLSDWPSVYKCASKSVVLISLQDTENAHPQAVGSGFFWTSKRIITSAHVLRSECSSEPLVTIQFQHSHRRHPVFIDQCNEKYDIAVLLARPSLHGIAPLPRRQHAVAIGEAVAVLGAPFGLAGSFTRGVLSGKNRTVHGESNSSLNKLLQTDAAVHPGSSGAPLLDSNGRVIGVVCARADGKNGFAGIGFALPVELVEQIVNVESATGHQLDLVTRSRL